MFNVKNSTKDNSLNISLSENIIGLILFFIGINILIGQVPSRLSYTVLFIAAFSLFVGLLFIVDTFLYNSLSSVIPGFLLVTFPLLIMLDFLLSFPISYGSIIIFTILIGGSFAFAFLAKETIKKSYVTTAWIFITLLLLQLVSKIPHMSKYFWNLWPVALIVVGVLLLINIYKKRN
ncbi:MAG: hypothetical protein KAH01_04645 [Caldisericia bacterium]|nr:hypothetical protein [Caldisericia bacterium]